MNPRLEPLLAKLEAGSREIARRTEQLHQRVLDHEHYLATGESRLKPEPQR